MSKPKILAFAGSLREGSFNKKLVRAAAAEAEKGGAEVTVIDLKNYPLPVYDGDIEAKDGLPENALKLKEVFGNSDGFLISAPEYNSSVTAALKNTIDWVSRPAEGEPYALYCFKDKIAGLISASPGALGGLRGLVHLRAILQNIGCLVIPIQKSIPKANEAFDENGGLKDAKQKDDIANVARSLVETARKLRT